LAWYRAWNRAWNRAWARFLAWYIGRRGAERVADVETGDGVGGVF
jgi:hypothetical protein